MGSGLGGGDGGEVAVMVVDAGGGWWSWGCGRQCGWWVAIVVVGWW